MEVGNLSEPILPDFGFSPGANQSVMPLFVRFQRVEQRIVFFRNAPIVRVTCRPGDRGCCVDRLVFSLTQPAAHQTTTNVQMLVQPRNGGLTDEREVLRVKIRVLKPKALRIQNTAQAIRAKHHLWHLGNDRLERKAANQLITLGLGSIASSPRPSWA